MRIFSSFTMAVLGTMLLGACGSTEETQKSSKTASSDSSYHKQAPNPQVDGRDDLEPKHQGQPLAPPPNYESLRRGEQDAMGQSLSPLSRAQPNSDPNASTPDISHSPSGRWPMECFARRTTTLKRYLSDITMPDSSEWWDSNRALAILLISVALVRDHNLFRKWIFFNASGNLAAGFGLLASLPQLLDRQEDFEAIFWRPMIVFSGLYGMFGDKLTEGTPGPSFPVSVISGLLFSPDSGWAIYGILGWITMVYGTLRGQTAEAVPWAFGAHVLGAVLGYAWRYFDLRFLPEKKSDNRVHACECSCAG